MRNVLTVQPRLVVGGSRLLTKSDGAWLLAREFRHSPVVCGSTCITIFGEVPRGVVVDRSRILAKSDGVWYLVNLEFWQVRPHVLADTSRISAEHRRA